VGEDQVSHVELSREIVRKFNLHNVVLNVEELSQPQNSMALVVLEGSFTGVTKFGQVSAPVHPDAIRRLERLVRERIAQVGLENFLEHLQKLGAETKDRDVPREQIQYFAEFKRSHAMFRTFIKEMLSEPQVMLTQTPRVPGLDGRKMSKSY